MNQDKMERGFRLLLEGLGFNPQEEAWAGSARRAASAWHDDLCAGLASGIPPLELMPLPMDFDNGLVRLDGIPVKSLCAHHLLPFHGSASIAYVPEKSLCGLSNLSKVLNHFARQPQFQEHLTGAVARHLMETLAPKGVGVRLQASHYCMTLRGVNHPGVLTTHSLLGCFRDDPLLRAEFLAPGQPAAPQESVTGLGSENQE